MAGTLGLDRSYLSMLESGRRPVSDSIVNRAVAVMYEARRLDRSPDLQAVKEWVAKMSTDSLVTIYELRGQAAELGAPPHPAFLPVHQRPAHERADRALRFESDRGKGKSPGREARA